MPLLRLRYHLHICQQHLSPVHRLFQQCPHQDRSSATASKTMCEGRLVRLCAAYPMLNCIDRTNLEVSSANAQLLQPFPDMQIHPMLSAAGYYPIGFTTPLSLFNLLSMGDQQLQRIMMAYQLAQRNAPYQPALRNDFIAGQCGYPQARLRRLENLLALLQYLGAYRLAEHLKRCGCDRSLELSRPGAGVLDCC